MADFIANHYAWVKACHIIAVMAWMAGMLYLPRLFVYHAVAEKGSDKSATFKVMERRLMRAIINPAMIATWVLGGLMLWANPDLLHAGWFHVKLTLVILMSALHGVFSKWRKQFARDENTRAANFYRVWNEAPTALLVVIVLLAVAKPF
jgi:putative membrane protein